MSPERRRLRRALVFATDQLEPLVDLARRCEEGGLDRVWTTEYVGRDATARALAIALGTERIEVGTGITYAFGKLPLSMAALAADIDRLSGGRFALGISSGTKGVRRWYGASGFEPAAPAIAEYVRSLREAWAKDPELGTPPRVHAAALNAAMSRTVAATCDGALIHALGLARIHLHERLIPAMREGLARREDGGPIEIAAWCVTAVDDDAGAARERARKQLAFYLSTPSYAPVTAGASWEGAAAAVRDAFGASGRKASWGELAPLVPDAAVDELAIWGTPAEVGEKATGLEDELRPLGVTELVFQTAGADVSAAELISDCERIADSLGTGRG